MKHIIYIGNLQANHKNTNPSGIDTLAPLLKQWRFDTVTASHKTNKLFRLMHMLWTCFKHRKQTDVVLIDTYSTLNFYYAFLVSLLCQCLQLKYIPILHGGYLPQRLKRNPRLSKRIFKNAYVNVSPSLYLKQVFETLGYDNITHIPNGINLQDYNFIKNRSYDTITLLWVRSFSEIYNPMLAVKVLKTLKDDNITASLYMVGPNEHSCFNDVKDYAEKHELDVSFTGKLSKKDWILLSQSCNIFINTTNIDNMPVSVIEAMALGLPVVSTNVGGIPFLITHNQTGILVETNSVRDFKEGIKTIIESPIKRTKIVIKAREYVMDFDWKSIKKQWRNLLT